MEASRLTGTNGQTASETAALQSRAAVDWSISFILPVGRAVEQLAVEVRSIAAALTGATADFEILLVASSAEPAEMAAAHAAAQQCDGARLIECDAKLSYGAAVRAGLQQAHKNYVAFAAGPGRLAWADLTWISCLAARCDVVCGGRIDRQEGWFRRLSAKTYSLAADWLLGTRVHDCGGAFKLLRRDVARALELTSETTFLHAELLSKARLRQLSVVEVDTTQPAPGLPVPRFSARSAFMAVREALRFWWNQVMFPAPAALGAAPPRATVRPWHVGLLFFIAALMLFTRLTFPLIEPDEARYALIAAGMYENGDFLVPARQGMPYFDKPPLLYWLAAANFYVLGMHDYAARLVPAMAGMGTVAATFFVGRRLVGERGALLGSLALLLCLGFVLTSRFFIMDGLLTCFATLALLSLYVAVQGPRLQVGWWLLAAAACAMGMLTKGPVILVITVPPLMAWRWLSGKGAAIGLRHGALFAVTTAAIALPWFAAVAMRDPNFVKFFLWEHHVMRFTTNYMHVEPWWFYGMVLVPGMFPATLLLPILGTYLFRRTSALLACRTPAQGFLLLASVWTLLFFSLSTGKLAPYILPAVPPLCLLLGAMLDTAVLSEINDAFMTRMRRWIPFHGTRIALIAGVALGVADYIINSDKPHQLFESVLVILASCFLYWYVSRASFALRPARWPMTAAVPLVLLMLGMVDIYPTIAGQRSLAAHVNAFRQKIAEPDIPVMSFGYYEDSLIFYNPLAPIPQFNNEQREQVREFFAAHPRVLVIAQAEDLPRLRSYLPEGTTFEAQARTRGKLYFAVAPRDDAHALSAEPAGEQRR